MAWPMPRPDAERGKSWKRGCDNTVTKYRLGPVLVRSPPGCAISRHSFSSVRTPDSLFFSSSLFSFLLPLFFHLLYCHCLSGLVSLFHPSVVTGVLLSSRIQTTTVTTQIHTHRHTQTHRQTNNAFAPIPFSCASHGLFPLLSLLCHLVDSAPKNRTRKPAGLGNVGTPSRLFCRRRRGCCGRQHHAAS